MTEDEALALITRLVGSQDPMVLYPFEFGWVAQPRLPARTPGEPPSGAGLGLGSYVIDKDGVVTVHPSVPIPMVKEMYADGRRQGRIVGRRIWPDPPENDRTP
jgi:hypothetical protein